MYQRKIPLDLNCGISVATEVILAKWKFHILSKIDKGITRPKDLQEVIPLITKRVLHNQLKQLESYGIVEKSVYAEVPLRTEYALTKDGETILAILDDLNNWGLEFAPKLKAIMNTHKVL